MITIKKQISLAFLGEEYKDSFIVVSSIAVKDYDEFQKSQDSVKDTVVKHFISGEIQQGEEKVALNKDNLEELPGEVFVKCFEEMIGKLDPKVEPQ